MFRTYTPENVGRKIIFKRPSGQYEGRDTEIYIGGQLVSINKPVNDDWLVITVFEKDSPHIEQLITNVELDFIEHESNENFYYAYPHLKEKATRKP